jgi:pimeloyl-ACP methyl ester carboxylesterase
VITEAKRRISSRTVNYQKAGSQNAPAILLLHGLGTRASFWQPVMPRLVEAGYQVYALDLPGFGYTDLPNRLYTPENIAELLNLFTRALGLEKVIVIGHSMGGAIAAGFASIDPTSIKALVLVDAFGLSDDWIPVSPTILLDLALPSIYYRFTRQSERLIQSILEANFHVPERLNPAVLDMAIAEDWTGHGKSIEVVYGLGVSLALRHQRRKLIQGLRSNFLQYGFPFLVIWGQHDRLIPISSAHHIKSEIPEIELRIIPDCGHVPPLEVTDEFNQLLVEFIKTLD